MKKTIIGPIILLVGLILTAGSFKMLPNFKPLGASVAILVLGALWVITGFKKIKWNKKMYAGAILTILSVFSLAPTAEMLPDPRPLFTMIAVLIAGLVLLAMGLHRSSSAVVPNLPIDKYQSFGYLVGAGLAFISFILLPQINWQHPKDPAAVMILAFLSALLILYATIKKHPAQKQIIWAGAIAIINFILVPVYEAGILDFLGRFYRLFIPLYAWFDNRAVAVEYFFIFLSLLFTLVYAIKKKRVSEYGKITLFYFLLQIFLAIFLFEMLGLPAGFLAGDTTRSDLLVTDTNAVMSTFGMVFIASFMYICFQLFPFWVAPLLAGIWWVFWKPWLLHHPDPAMFTSWGAFLPAAGFLFFTGLKRVALPMIILVFFLDKFQKKKA